jgi:APA family basic amino acid/polyamine antiporter
MTQPAQIAEGRGELARDLNLSHATAIVAGTVIGSGIFLVPAEMMQAVGSAKLVYAAWIVGGVLSFFGALTYAELSALRPYSGGEYVFVRDGYGPLAGFLYAWTYFLIAKPASIATIAVGVVRVSQRFPAFHWLESSFFAQHLSPERSLTLTYGNVLAIFVTLLITALNYIGVRRAGIFQLIFTVLKVIMILVVVAAGFLAASGTFGNFGTSFAGAKGGVAGFMAALVAALWAYDGWSDLGMLGGEVRRPEKTIPFALIAGMTLVAILYMATNAAIQYAMPAASVAQSPVPAETASTVVLGAHGVAIVLAGMALSMLVGLNGTVMSGARIPYAAARDGYFFKALAEVHPRFHTPAVALLVQAALAILLIMAGGAFRELFSLAIFSEWLFYLLAASTVFIFRRREPDVHRPYRVWGYPFSPALFIVAAAVLLYYTFTENLRNSFAGTCVILAGIPVFYWFSRRRVSR